MNFNFTIQNSAIFITAILAGSIINLFSEHQYPGLSVVLIVVMYLSQRDQRIRAKAFPRMGTIDYDGKRIRRWVVVAVISGLIALLVGYFAHKEGQSGTVAPAVLTKIDNPFDQAAAEVMRAEQRRTQPANEAADYPHLAKFLSSGANAVATPSTVSSPLYNAETRPEGRATQTQTR